VLTNQWYVAGEAASVTTEPKPLRLLGQDLVLFRDAAGALACLSDVCIHRGASLSRGRTVDGCVECPYHGWRYASDGRVTKIPAEPDAKIPARARIDSYPVVERYGWIWVFVGSLPEAARPPIPDMPEYADPSIRWIRGVWDWNVNYHRAVENGLDFAHAPFVHGSAFGDRNRPQIDDFVVEEKEWSSHSKMIMGVPRNVKGLWSFIYKEPITKVEARPWFHMSGPIAGLELFPRAGWQIWIRTAHMPVDEHHTRSWWLMGRNFMKAAMFDKDSIRRNIKIFSQDAAVIQHLKPELVPDSWREELTVKTDALQVSYRRKVRSLEAKGWKIDTPRIEAEFVGRRACTLPSPARASENFVLETVPLESRTESAS
jgi:phenylpropionate dioxygenase-like ring-hydroxylating dioxygenase large terminal subunit